MKERRKIMAQKEVKKLDSGDFFPKMEFKLTDGTALTLPDRDDGIWRVLLVYRGRW
jgi:peroxiredoxin